MNFCVINGIVKWIFEVIKEYFDLWGVEVKLVMGLGIDGVLIMIGWKEGFIGYFLWYNFYF